MNTPPSSSSFMCCRRVPIESLAIKCTVRTFALCMRDESMRGRSIHEHDIVVLEHGIEPKHCDVVAALIDNESVVRTYVVERGRSMLQAAHRELSTRIPANELVIQGVVVTLLRHRKDSSI